MDGLEDFELTPNADMRHETMEYQKTGFKSLTEAAEHLRGELDRINPAWTISKQSITADTRSFSQYGWVVSFSAYHNA